jgi:uncharacterized membrane protein YbhN (UPF0104 family)
VNKKNLFQYLVYASVLFLLIALLRADYLVFPKNINIAFLSFSFVLLFTGFLINGFGWFFAVNTFQSKKVPYRDAIVSYGLSIFGKYIPGKIWIVLGRARYISEKHKTNTPFLVSISFLCQAAAIIASLSLGILIGFHKDLWQQINAFNPILLLVLSAFPVFLFLVRKRLKRSVSSYFEKKGIHLKELKISKLILLLSIYFFNWIIWSVAFYLLAKALFEMDFTILIGFAFSLSTAVGILALIAPGGIGVREATLVSILLLFTIPKAEATSIATFSRLWYLAGELFIFSVALFLRIKDGSEKKKD